MKENKIFNNVCLIIILVIFFILFGFKYSENKLSEIFYPFIGFFLTLKLSIFLDKYGNFKFLVFSGKNSLIFYLSEPFFAVIYRVILVRIIDLKYYYIIIILFFVLKFISVYISAFVINKIKILSLLFGNKIVKKG